MNDIQERFAKFQAMGGEGILLVGPEVNLDDLLHSMDHPNAPAIVRVSGGDLSNVMRWVPTGCPPVDCMAGWVSEDA